MFKTAFDVREFRRVRRTMTAKIATGDGRHLVCPVLDIGLGGLRVRSANVLEMGDTCTLMLSLDAMREGHTLEASGRVVRVEERGAAIQFVDMATELFDQLDRLAALATAPDDD